MIMMGFGSLSIYLLNSILPLSWVLIIEATMIFFTARKELVWLSIFKGFNRSLVNANVDKLTLNSVRLCYCSWRKKIYCISLRTKRFATSFISEMVRRINSTVRNRKQNKMLGSDLVGRKVKSLKSKQLKIWWMGRNIVLYHIFVINVKKNKNRNRTLYSCTYCKGFGPPWTIYYYNPKFLSKGSLTQVLGDLWVEGSLSVL